MREIVDQLRVSEARFAGIVGIASDAIVSIDESMRIVLYNQGAETIFGWTAEEALGRPLDLLLPERFRAVHREHIARFSAAPIAARRMGERQEIAGLRKNGEEFPAEASISKLDTETGRLFTVVLRDATERRRIERSQRFLARAGQLLVTSLDVATTLRSVAELAVEFLADCCVIYDAGDTGGVRRLETLHADPRYAGLMDELRNAPLDPRYPHPAIAVLETGVAELIPYVTEAYLVDTAASARCVCFVSWRSGRPCWLRSSHGRRRWA
jgi:PAS domain S-box-containing protein